MAAPHQPQLVFVDGTFEELAQEMAEFLSVGDDVKALIEKKQKDEVLKKLIIASPALHSIPEKDIAGAYNLLVYLTLQSENADKFLPRICDNLRKPITSSPVNGPGLALNVLTTIFNMLKPDDDLRFNVFKTILSFLKAHNMFETLKPYLKPLDDWMEDWEVDSEDQREVYEIIADIARDGGDVYVAYQYMLKALRTFEEEEVKSEEAQQIALRALKTALSSPTQYDFQDLLNVPCIQTLSETHPVYFELLTIFAEKDMEDYTQFLEEHEGFVEKEHMDAEKLQTKMRLLTFASLAARTQSREIPYADITKALQISDAEVELWTIDVIRAQLVEGRMSQQKKVFLVHRTTYRVFGEKQWRQLGDLVDTWRDTLTKVASTLRKEQANLEAQRKRDLEEAERKLANTGLSGIGERRRGGGDRGDRTERGPRKERTDDDD
ncbi:PCI-domain-containing protein [Xylariaceae sp. FL1019]|nr:PCI-domain-containing protein [Xylariaceae sp. FL1019]